MSSSQNEGNDFLMLDDAQLRQLAQLLLNQEEPLMNNIKSEPDRAKYLKHCNDAYNNVIRLMDSTNNFVRQYGMQGNTNKANVAKAIHKYIQYSINMSVQCVRNCCLRVSLVDKIMAHFDTLASDLRKIRPGDEANMQQLAADVSFYKECMFEYAINCKSDSARVKSKAYSKVLMQQGIEFPDLVNRHKDKLGIRGSFNFQKAVKKVEVYNKIIEDAGRAKFPKISKLSAKAGVPLMLISAGLTVWDIYTAEYSINRIVKGSLLSLSALGTSAVKVAVTTAAKTAMVGVGAAAAVVTVAGFVVGSLVGLLLSSISGYLIDQIMGSGGQVVPNLEGVQFYTAKTPDGMSLAYEIVHEDDDY